MFINQPSHDPHSLRAPLAGHRVDTTPSNDSKSEAVDAASKQSSLNHVRAAEINESAKAIRDIPEVRHELVNNVAERIASGEYFTANAAQRTAAAIIGTDN